MDRTSFYQKVSGTRRIESFRKVLKLAKKDRVRILTWTYDKEITFSFFIHIIHKTFPNQITFFLKRKKGEHFLNEYILFLSSLNRTFEKLYPVKNGPADGLFNV